MNAVRWPLAAIAVVVSLQAWAAPQATAQQQAPEAQQQVPGALRYIPPEAFAAATVQPAALFKVETLQLLPLEVIQAASLQNLAIDPAKVSRVVVFAEGPLTPARPPGYGMVLEFTEPVDANKILPMLQVALPEGAPPQTRALWPHLMAVEGNRVLLAPEATLDRMKAAAVAKPGSLQTRLAALADTHLATVVEMAPVRDDLNALLAQAPEVPPPFAELRNLPSLIEHVQGSVDLGDTVNTRLRVQGVDGQAADKLQALVGAALQMMRIAVIQETQQGLQNDDPIQQAQASYGLRMADHFIVLFTPQREGNALVWEAKQGVQVAIVGGLTALLLPAIQAARESARTVNSLNNLRQICIACLLYADRHGKLPDRYSVDKDGKPLLSWRVHLLPYLEQNALYQQFKLDEPWDSPHNRKLIEQMPAIYGNPNVPSSSQTTYQVLVGPGTLYEKRTPPTLEDLDKSVGASNVVLAVESDANHAVVWTKPEDLSFPADRAIPAGLGNLRPGDIFLAVFCDGHASRSSTAGDPAVPKLLAPFRSEEND